MSTADCINNTWLMAINLLRHLIWWPPETPQIARVSIYGVMTNCGFILQWDILYGIVFLTRGYRTCRTAQVPLCLRTHIFTGWDTKIRNLLFGLFWFKQVSKICSNVPEIKINRADIRNLAIKTSPIKTSQTKGFRFWYPTQCKSLEGRYLDYCSSACLYVRVGLWGLC